MSPTRPPDPHVTRVDVGDRTLLIVPHGWPDDRIEATITVQDGHRTVRLWVNGEERAIVDGRAGLAAGPPQPKPQD